MLTFCTEFESGPVDQQAVIVHYSTGSREYILPDVYLSHTLLPVEEGFQIFI
jgi:hypothetical protein